MNHADLTSTPPQHYLERELYERVRTDPAIFDFLQKGTLDGLWYWDIEKPENEWMSPNFWTLFGYDPASKPHLASAWQDMIFAADLQLALDNFQRHCADPEQPYDQVVRYRHRDGSTIWVRCRGIAIRDASGTPIRMLGAHTDLTPLKRTEAELRSRTAELEQVNRQLGEFAAAASHDLQTPLSTISQLLDMFAQRLQARLDEPEKSMLVTMQSSLDRLQEMIEGLLEYSQVTNTVPKRQHVDLKRILADLTIDLGISTASATTPLRYTQLPIVWGDPILLRQLLQNLLTNALKFHRPHCPPVIEISASEDAQRWLIQVKDNGIGIPADQLHNIFKPFKRLHTRREFAGSGVGLASCQRAIDAHGGRIWAESEPGQGTTMCFSLPKPDSPEDPGSEL